MKRALRIAGLGLLTGTALTLAGMASAQDAHRMGDRGGMRGPQISFAELDANGDGSISAEDLTARANERFTTADADGNGSLTLEELTNAGVARFDERYQERLNAAAPGEVPGRPSDAQVLARAEKMASGMLQRADADRNGAVEQSEMAAMPGFERMFDRVDTDEDGAITQAEFDAARERMMGRMDRHGDERGMRGDHDMRNGHDMREGHGPREGRPGQMPTQN